MRRLIGGEISQVTNRSIFEKKGVERDKMTSQTEIPVFVKGLIKTYGSLIAIAGINLAFTEPLPFFPLFFIL